MTRQPRRRVPPHWEDSPERKERWAWLTEGIKNKWTRICTEILLDNQVDYGNNTNDMMLTEDIVTTSNITAFTTFALPLIRRVFPRLIAQELVSVQPMPQPTGKIFFYDIDYSGGNRVDILANFDSGYGVAAEGQPVPELNLNISSDNVVAISRKLKAQWSMEAQQDLDAYFGLDAGGELMNATSDEIAREVDRDIITDLVASADVTNNADWHYTIPGSGPYSTLDPRVYNATLYDAIVDANNNVYKKRYRNCNWILGSADDCARLEKLEQFRLFPAPDPQGTIVTGPNLFGTISGRYSVYKDPWLPNGKLLLGYKGTSPFDTGYVYAPYVALMTTLPFTDPNTLKTVRAMMTRYAKKSVISQMFATVTISA